MADEWGLFIVEDTLDVAYLDAEAFELREEVEQVCLSVAERSLDYAKTNAPWQDRTGDARRGLDVEVDSDPGNVYIQLFHTVDYGLWLEVIQNGRFSIIMPTLEGYTSSMLSEELAI